MARNIRATALALFVAFAVLSLSLVYWQVVRAGDLTADSRYNATRLAADADRIQRGRILDRNGAVLADTVSTADGRVRRYTTVSLAHLIGYASPQWGNSGVEAAYNGWLRGDRAADPIGELLDRTLHRERVGADVVLTVDSKLQAAAEAALGESAGAIVALDPTNGEVLAMVSHPLFDPNGVKRAMPRLTGLDSAPLVNRATQGLYPPGSTFKLVTLAAALASNAANPGTTFTLDQTLQVQLNNYVLRWQNPVNRPLSLTDSLVYSCNTCYAELGIAVGPDRLRNTAERFGFETRLPIELDSAPSRLGRTVYLNDKGGLGFTAFGQGELEATPLQMALVAATVANGGNVPTPHVARDVQDERGRVLQSLRPGNWRNAIAPETARFVAQAMVALVDAGQATAVQLPGVKVAAKTGTAEIKPGDEPHSWLVAFAPAEKPSLALAVIIEHGGFGSRAAAPAAAKVLAAALNR